MTMGDAMTQKSAIFLAFALTVFALVLVGSVIATVAPGAVDARSADAVTQRQVPTATAAPPGTTVEAPRPITGSDAAAIARSAVGGARLTQAAELVEFRGTLAYEVLLDRATVYVDATTGEVIEALPASDPADAQFARRPDRAGRDRDEREQHDEYWDDDHEEEGDD